MKKFLKNSDILTLVMSVVVFVVGLFSQEVAILAMYVFMYVATFKLFAGKDTITFGIVVAGYGIGLSNEGYVWQFQLLFYFGIIMSILSLAIMHKQKDYRLSVVDIALTCLLIVISVFNNYGRTEFLLLGLSLVTFVFAFWYQIIKNKNNGIIDMPNNYFGIFSLILVKVILKK